MAIATELWLVVIVARLVAEVGQYPAIKSMMDEEVAKAAKDRSSPRETVDLLRTLASPGVLITGLVIGALVVTAATVALLWFARQGHNWARLLLAGASLYVVVSAVLSVVFFGIDPSWVAVPLIVAAVAAGGAIAGLMRRDTEAWCADMTLYRRQAAAAKHAGFIR